MTDYTKLREDYIEAVEYANKIRDMIINEDLTKELSHMDREISKFYHQIEFLDFTDDEYLEVTLKLKECLQARREIKTMISVQKSFISASGKLATARVHESIAKALEAPKKHKKTTQRLK